MWTRLAASWSRHWGASRCAARSFRTPRFRIRDPRGRSRRVKRLRIRVRAPGASRDGALGFARRACICGPPDCRPAKRARDCARVAIAAGLGAAGALAFEPFRLFPLLLLAYGGFVLLLDGAHLATAPHARCGAHGLGLRLRLLFRRPTIGSATRSWSIPRRMPGSCRLRWCCCPRASRCSLPPPPRSACTHGAPACSACSCSLLLFAIAEWLRGHILTGFPWNLPGYGWSARLLACCRARPCSASMGSRC